MECGAFAPRVSTSIRLAFRSASFGRNACDASSPPPPLLFFKEGVGGEALSLTDPEARWRERRVVRVQDNTATKKELS